MNNKKKTLDPAVLFAAFKYASSTSHYKLCRLLRKYADSPNFVGDIASLVDEKGQTLLHIACLNMSLGTVKVLVESYGFDPTVEDDNGATPVEIAYQEGKDSIVEYLKSKCHVSPALHNKYGTCSIIEEDLHCYDEATLPKNFSVPSISKGKCRMPSLNSHAKVETDGESAQEIIVLKENVKNGHHQKRTSFSHQDAIFKDSPEMSKEAKKAKFRPQNLEMGILSMDPSAVASPAYTDEYVSHLSCLEYIKVLFSVLALGFGVVVSVGIIVAIIYFIVVS